MTRPSPPQTWQMIDTTHPLRQGWRGVLGVFHDWPDLARLNLQASTKGLTNARHLSLQFTEQIIAHGQRAYEALIYNEGKIPTRSRNWHDFLNACAWLNFPETKSALNHRHCNEPASQTRTARSDAATLFDESGAILIGPDPRLANWLQEHRWHEAFVVHRELWKSHHLILIGHAVLEKTLNPYPGMIAKVCYEPWQPLDKEALDSPPAGLDHVIAKRWLGGEFTHPGELFAMPVLGIPGADPDNANPSYYSNADVFRPKRQSANT
jgi:hypothetical protein